MTIKFNKVYQDIISENNRVDEMLFKPKVAIITTFQDVIDALDKTPLRDRIIRYLYITNPSNEHLVKKSLENYLTKSRKISTKTKNYTPTIDKDEFIKIDIDKGYRLFRKMIQDKLDLLSINYSTNFNHLITPKYLTIL